VIRSRSSVWMIFSEVLAVVDIRPNGGLCSVVVVGEDVGDGILDC
jgi:hypothetical protein